MGRCPGCGSGLCGLRSVCGPGKIDGGTNAEIDEQVGGARQKTCRSGAAGDHPLDVERRDNRTDDDPDGDDGQGQQLHHAPTRRARHSGLIIHAGRVQPDHHRSVHPHRFLSLALRETGREFLARTEYLLAQLARTWIQQTGDGSADRPWLVTCPRDAFEVLEHLGFESDKREMYVSAVSYEDSIKVAVETDPMVIHAIDSLPKAKNLQETARRMIVQRMNKN